MPRRTETRLLTAQILAFIADGARPTVIRGLGARVAVELALRTGPGRACSLPRLTPVPSRADHHSLSYGVMVVASYDCITGGLTARQEAPGASRAVSRLGHPSETERAHRTDDLLACGTAWAIVPGRTQFLNVHDRLSQTEFVAVIGGGAGCAVTRRCAVVADSARDRRDLAR